MNPHKPKTYYSMSFDYKFDQGGDQLYIAYTVPYTFSMIQSHLSRLKTLDAEFPNQKCMSFSSIGKSNGNLDLSMIKITNPNPNPSKPAIFIIGRQHSGETYSSFIIHGLINFLISKDPIANSLREALEFWIVPAVNPDGIVLGNYRCNIQGKDMNRYFSTPEE